MMKGNRNMKKISAFIAAFALFFSGFTAVFAEEQEDTEKSGVYEAASAVLMEANTGQVLYAQNPDEKLPIASVTKIMTLLIAAEEMKAGRLNMEDTVVASYNAFATGGSVIWLNEGEKMSVYDILRSVVISSANDACVALAEHIAATEEAFVRRMNKRAEDLEMTDTHFVNCTGLDAENHWSTASDVAKMAAELRKYDYYDEFLLTRLTYVREGTDRETQLLNTNKLLYYDGITGLKTGTTDNAGYCFTATARRGGMELVAVVLGAKTDESRFDIAEQLLDYGFSGFELFSPEFDPEQLHDITVKGGVQKTVSITPTGGSQCLIPKGTGSRITYLYDIRQEVKAPVSTGDYIGKIIVLHGDNTLFVVNVTAASPAEEQTFFKSFLMVLRGLFLF